jgi:O-antigen ligase
MMEGIYFFGEHVRWNLGWNNPNQAGAFIAMWIPWLWAVGLWVVGARNEKRGGQHLHVLRRDLAIILVLVVEMALWFLLCKTYSRGALVAVGVSGVVLLLWRFIRDRRFKGIGMLSVRLVVIGGLLLATEFFSRIDPRFVSQDASAGNRLVLWKGGLQMISVSPWQGWGKGQSGSGFTHWFQPLDATEKYAGMVNSYLHVGVEYGLPMLVAVMTGAVGLCFLAWGNAKALRTDDGIPREVANTLMVGAGFSCLVFLIANVFSTLWIFGNLWWLPAVNGAVILGVGWAAGMRGLRVRGARASGVAAILSMLVTTGILFVGRLIPRDTGIAYHPGEKVVITGDGRNEGQVIFFPESSVLGDDWGKEIRRLATAGNFRGMEISSPLADSQDVMNMAGICPRMIIACGSQFAAGFSALLKYPDARLILVHPVGKPDVADNMKGNVLVIMPMLDTRNSGRGWKVFCKKMGWPISVSPGVGQDIRAVWPGVLRL